MVPAGEVGTSCSSALSSASLIVDYLDLTDTMFSNIAESSTLSEKASIDEAYLDLTALTIQEILTRNPHLSSVPPGAPLGLDTPLPLPTPVIMWQNSGNIFPIGGEKSKPESPGGEGNHHGYDIEEYEDEDGNGAGTGGWEDYALSLGAEIMGKIREEVKTVLGYTCSAVSLRLRFR